MLTSESKATAETVKLGPPHEPKEESIKAFKEVEHELKKQLVHIRHQHDSMPRLPPNLYLPFRTPPNP